MFIHKRREFDPQGAAEGREVTPEATFLNRRKWLKRSAIAAASVGALGAAGYTCWQAYQGNDAQVIESGQTSAASAASLLSYFPAPRDDRFEYGRAETNRAEAARYTNFYEFSRFKWVWRHIDAFEPYPWRLTIDGLCRNAITLDIEMLYRRYQSKLVERQYRHRCVETWAMAVPWSGFPLSDVLRDADPLPRAKYVRFVSFHRPDVAGNQTNAEFPWPYTEGLTLSEAMNELPLLAVGVYGKPLLKQHGAPVRLVVPWKYGYKSIKSIERIELVEKKPATFWTTILPQAYPFESNVNPAAERPWPQHEEKMLGTGEIYSTMLYNGYGKYVAELYAASS